MSKLAMIAVAVWTVIGLQVSLALPCFSDVTPPKKITRRGYSIQLPADWIDQVQGSEKEISRWAGLPQSSLWSTMYMYEQPAPAAQSLKQLVSKRRELKLADGWQVGNHEFVKNAPVPCEVISWCVVREGYAPVLVMDLVFIAPTGPVIFSGEDRTSNYEASNLYNLMTSIARTIQLSGSAR